MKEESKNRPKRYVIGWVCLTVLAGIGFCVFLVVLASNKAVSKEQSGPVSETPPLMENNTDNGFVLCDEEYIYYFCVDPVMHYGKIIKQSRVSEEAPIALVDEMSEESTYMFYALGGMRLVGDRIYYFGEDSLTSHYELFWVRKDGSRKGMISHNKFLNDYMKMAEEGKARSVYRIYQQSPTYFYEAYMAQPNGYSYYGFDIKQYPYQDGNTILYDSTFLIRLNQSSIEPVPFPDRDSYVYESYALYRGTVYYVKYPALEYESVRENETTDLYAFDLSKQTETLVCTLPVSPLVLARDTFYRFYENAFYYVNKEHELMRTDLETGENALVCTNVATKEEAGNLLVNGDRVFYNTLDGEARFCNIDGTDNELIPGYEALKEKYNKLILWGIAGDRIYYNTKGPDGIVYASIKETVLQ